MRRETAGEYMMRRAKAANPRPGESQDAPKPKAGPPRRYKSRWELEQDRVIQHLRAAGWSDRAILEQIQEVPINSMSGLVELANRAGPFHLYTEERYRELGL